MSLRPEVIAFLNDSMRVDVKELLATINDPQISEFNAYLFEAIHKYFDALSSQNYEDDIQNVYFEYELLHQHEKAHSILDALRHAFDGFAFGGLHQLYTRQENEGWYPKIKLIEELKPNDISSLEEMVTIYRGCDENEFQSNNYGQSWTTSIKIAELFAYQHYSFQEWFNLESRVVVTAVIPRSAVLFSDQSIEFEVIINTEKLIDVILYSKEGNTHGK
jgi:hypothetical protein